MLGDFILTKTVSNTFEPIDPDPVAVKTILLYKEFLQAEVPKVQSRRVPVLRLVK